VPSQVFVDAFLQRDTSEVVLVFLTIDHSLLFGQPARLVLNTKDVTSRGNLHKAAYFEYTLPDQSPDRTPRAKLVLDNVSREMVQAFREAGLESPTVVIEVACGSTPDVIELATPPLEWKRVEYNHQQLSGDLLGPAILNRRFPKDVYSPQTTPGIFKGPPL
jgi:hypothetical protein